MKWCILPFIVVSTATSMLLAARDTQGGDANRVYSVCEVLRRLDSLNGKLISVRGVVSGGQGIFLIDSCKSKLIVKGFTWPNAIWLLNPMDQTPFEGDSEAYRRAWDKVKRMQPHKSDEIVMTFVGLLEAKDLDKVTGLNSLGKPIGFGFGPGNLAPAQLRIKTVMNPQVVRKNSKAK